MKELLMEKKSRFVQYFIACLFFIVSDVMQAFIFARIFQTIEVATNEYFNETIWLSVGYIVISATLFLTSRMLRIAFMRDVLLSVRVRAFDKILHMSLKEFNQKSRDVYISNLTNDINTFENTFFMSLLNFILRCGSYVVILGILMFVNWSVGLIIFAISLIVLGISKLYENHTIKLQQEKSDENEKFTVNVANTFNGLEILKLNNIEQMFLKRSKNQIATLEKKKLKFNFFTALQSHTNEAIGSIVMLGLIVYLMYSPNHAISIGSFVLVIQLAGQAVFPLVRMLPLYNVLKSSVAIYHKITDQDHDEEETNNRANPYNFENQITVRGLSFAYDQKQVFKYLNFTIEKGKKYLLNGPSGSGKTTLIKLLSMAYDDYEGQIDIDGVDLKTIQTQSFNKNVSFIYQDVFLFEASIGDNISLFKDTDYSQMKKAAEMAGLKDFIASFDSGMDTLIAENGKNLSGGERQRISIARALYKKADILFVDEASSSLNDELGRAIEATILGLDATVIAISHKYFEGLSEKYDYVLELKDGYINQYLASDYFNGGE
ncbi:MAG: ABC transporter ATP-binding protein [Candidatus Izemoplasmatales bacterium]|jgi:ABC-type multidrug transport system fused ATPase/permease subunit